MKNARRLLPNVLGGALVLATLAACHGSGDDDDSTPSGEAFAASLIQSDTDDSAEPAEVNDLDLEFSEDPDAFADLFD